ncbi:MAG: hypothetical protein EXS68_02650 [Candidatus Ryanbacteria bacterium]|nr:hypothetical protein [Candidatus Ryanbacteria bacterium]
MPAETLKPKVIHLETQIGDIDPRTGRSPKPSESGIHGLRTTRAEQRREQAAAPPPDTTRRPDTK